MTVFVLIREDQNQHGYVDVTIDGMFRNEAGAKRRADAERTRARQCGLRLAEDARTDGNWQVSWHVASHLVRDK